MELFEKYIGGDMIALYLLTYYINRVMYACGADTFVIVDVQVVRSGEDCDE